MGKIRVAIIGSGNIGTDLMIKVMRISDSIEVAALVGVDPNSDGLARAQRLGVATTFEGIAGLRAMPEYADIKVVFDATSAGAHVKHAEILAADGKQIIDLTPAAIGPYCVPPVNLDEQIDAANVNMVTCGGQATIPMVAAVSRVTPVHYAEIVASIASRSAGPGTRTNVDEFTETTSRALEKVGGAKHGKAIIVLNPAEPPLIMRDTIFCLADAADADLIRKSVERMAETVQCYVPGYRLKQEVQVDTITADKPIRIPGRDMLFTGVKVTIFLEVEGAAHYLPAYAGNLDVMTSAALRTAERLVELRKWS